MEHLNTSALVAQLVTGFEDLQNEYRQLSGLNEVLEKKLQTAREQYNELAKSHGIDRASTPPLSLSSSTKAVKTELTDPGLVSDILAQHGSSTAAESVRLAQIAVDQIRSRSACSGVKIWSGPSADNPEAATCGMPSITESPLEQDFTVEGVPSKLECPFASMANKKLSSHAASIVSRYNHRNSTGTGSVTGNYSSSGSAISRINGRDSLAHRRQSRQSRRTSALPDPIKAEICGLSDHSNAIETAGPPIFISDEDAKQDDNGVCPIRFLNQHSPEEIATYFENHKHELPRSHEVCVKRYQSNEESIKELDAKYGNLASMLQGLGQKHQPMLPDDPQEDEEGGEPQLDQESPSNAQITQWAQDVKGKAPAAIPPPPLDDVELEDEDRQPHFDRPLREIRVGESPSRPWGYNIPSKYLERRASADNSQAVADLPRSPALNDTAETQKDAAIPNAPDEEQPKGKCPFGFDAKEKVPDVAAEGLSQPTHHTSQDLDEAQRQSTLSLPQATQEVKHLSPVFAGSPRDLLPEKGQPRVIFAGPVFFGYSADDAAKLLKEVGLSINH
ncbi:hypothetical protein K431DRAFT_281785 [Polychaeton citri CBS 116435]|uniref:Uncharacterized protein n=1 Tax=Polychaeton citri CBS 116435 TaxID=1314669 RepID=A0A9P4UQR8_9PEZI|nr:hypothetical protein K431DRAFT_281785 [Polychaeton citri CBS 116435]